MRKIFLYWIEKEFKLISILRNLIYLHSKNGKGYEVNLITDDNIKEYIKEIPIYFNNMNPSQKADFVRVNVICDYGGIWLDSDTLVLNSLDSLFDLIEKKNGFFIKENNVSLINGVFGSRPNTEIMKKWKLKIRELIDCKKEKLRWTELGSSILKNIYNSDKTLYDNYEIFQGLDNIYPVNWINCVKEFIDEPYENYKTIIREYQPLIVLVNSVYKKLENKSDQEILCGNMPINYFLNKSFENMKLLDYDFIEIGTSNFDTLIQSCDNNTRGISVDAIKYYIDKLPEKTNVKKINIAISNIESSADVYYIPEKTIEKYNLQRWLKGCNCINKYHPLHIKLDLTHLCEIEKIKVIPCYKLFYENSVRKVKYLKIDTEGHDTIILKSLFYYLKYLPIIFYPNKILFESNSNSKVEDVDKIIELYSSLGYKLQSRGHDTMLIL